MMFAGLVAAIFLIGFLISQRGGDDEDVVAAGTSTTDAPDTTSTSGANGPGAAVPDCPPTDGSAERQITFSAAPDMCIDAEKDYSAVIATDVGDIEVDLLEDAAPKTVNNFVFLARYHFYDDVPFHRVIPGFVVQGGDAENKDGTGGPGYQFDDELPEEGDYEIGSVAMANSGPDTNGSQFFIVSGEDGASLPPQYSLFGTVTAGMDVVEAIEADGARNGSPETIHNIVTVTIFEK